MKQKFLLVDDDPDDCDFFLEAITRIDSSAECRIAGNGEDALNHLRSVEKDLPDYIFLDLNMPKMDGKTCLSELKNDVVLRQIPVVIFTTSSDPRDISETRELGAEHYITKPYEFHVLCEKLNSVIEKLKKQYF